jgi:hypothetical protein
MTNEIPQREHRGYTLQRDSHYMLWTVVATPDGSDVPSHLASKYTTFQVAEKEIDLLLEMLTKQQGLPRGPKAYAKTKLPTRQYELPIT